MEKTYFPLNRQGAVTAYIVTADATEDFKAPYTLKDQLRFEKEMRDILYEEPVGYPCPSVLGELAPNGKVWTYYASCKNPYVDFSKFYFTLQRISILARTVLVSDKKRTVRASVWSYAAFDMYLRGERVCRERVPVYQPIRRTDVTLDLCEGENDVFFAIQNFGVRDTRNMLMLEILDTDGIKTTLPIDEPILSELKRADDWFSALRGEGDKIIAPCEPDFEAFVNGDAWRGGCEFDVSGKILNRVSASVHGAEFSRYIEFCESRKIPMRKVEGDKALDIARTVLESKGLGEKSFAEVFKALPRHTSGLYVLAHLMLNGDELLPEHLEAIDVALERVLNRCDCADFELVCLLRLMISRTLPDEVVEKIKNAALAFRFWMDEEGADAMCFWSENHALTFYSCQMLMGKLWPNEVFMRSGRTGAEQAVVAKRRICEWLDVIEAEGFEEFCAGGYMGVTIAAALTVYEFADDESLKERARRVADRIIIESATQSFDGIHLSPMGRIYRAALIPHESSVQAILHIISDECADCSSVWLLPMMKMGYEIPERAKELLRAELDTKIYSGRAEINTRKRKNYYLTSVSSPRAEFDEPELDRESEYYKTKIMNESFHGTSLFTPGGHGYQQHLWYAALSNRFFTFVNLPGSERDFSGMRPGYWYGNLIFPSIRQEDSEQGSELYLRYVIPSDVPTKFTHAYFPERMADEVRCNGNFRFARVGEGYLALWCSETLEKYDLDATQGAELRAYGDDVSWYVAVGEAKEFGSFDGFIGATLAKGISREYVEKKFKNK